MVENRERLKKAVKELGTSSSSENGERVGKVSKDAIMKQMIPKNLLELSDEKIEGIYAQAYGLYNTGKYKDASYLFHILVQMDSANPKYTMGLAACLHMLKEYKSAADAYQLCSTIDPESPIPHYHAADCFTNLEDDLSAIVSLEMAVKRAREKLEYQSLKDRALLTIESLRKKYKRVASS